MADEGTPERLEMLTVVHWLDAGRPPDGRVALRLDEAALDLDLADGRQGLLDLMAALGELESRGVVTVGWPHGVGAGEAELTLSDALRRDAARLFGA